MRLAVEIGIVFPESTGEKFAIAVLTPETGTVEQHAVDLQSLHSIHLLLAHPASLIVGVRSSLLGRRSTAFGSAFCASGPPPTELLVATVTVFRHDDEDADVGSSI